LPLNLPHYYMQVPTFIWWSLKYSGKWPSVAYAGLCVYLLAGCKKLCGVTLFCNTPVLRCYGSLNTCHHQLIHHNLNLNQDLQQGKLEVWNLYKCFFSPHIQSRGGSYSELSCLRSEVILSITSELINPGVCCIILFSPGGIAWIYIWK
jgi:hypothetical protein